MKFGVASIGLLALLAPITAAWSKEDREIFRIRDEISTHEVTPENPDMTFYDLLGVPPTATNDDITKSFRKISRALHPDKIRQRLTAERVKANKQKQGGKPGVTVTKNPTKKELNAAIKIASDRQARLGLVRNILSGPDRERYDHFLANGFPVWKGTGYYYNRYRPGLSTVMVELFIFGGGAIHYIFLYMSWKRQRDFVERYIKFAREAAWGNNFGIPGIDGTPAAVPPPTAAGGDDEDGPPQALNRKQRRMQERDARKGAPKERVSGRSRRAGGTETPKDSAPASEGPTGARKKVQAENGKILIVDSLGDVYLEEQNEDGVYEEFLLDPNELAAPTVHDTALVRLPMWAYELTVGRVLGRSGRAADSSDDEGEGEEDDDSEPAQHTPGSDSAVEDFELLDKSTDSLAKIKASGAQVGGKANKRRTKKR